MADPRTYDDIRMAAVLVICATCGKSYYMTHPQLICQSCREKAAK